MHCTKILAEFEFGVIGPRLGVQLPIMWCFAEVVTHDAKRKQSRGADETSHRTQRAHKACVRLRVLENHLKLSSLLVLMNWHV